MTKCKHPKCFYFTMVFRFDFITIPFSWQNQPRSTCGCGASNPIPRISCRGCGEAILSDGPCHSCGTHNTIPRSSCESCGEVVRIDDDQSVYAASKTHPKPSIPADAVSLALAYTLANRANVDVPEEKLQYGFRQLPLNQPDRKITKHVPEEQLYVLDRPLLELRHPTKFVTASEEDSEDSHEEEEIGPERPGYNEIGYVPCKHHEPEFIVHRHHQEPEPPCTDPLPRAEIGACGFQLGQLTQDGDVQPRADSELFRSTILDRIRRSATKQ